MSNRTDSARGGAASVRGTIGIWLILGAFLTALLWPATADAHGADGLSDTDYLVTITSAPDIPGVTVRMVETGARLELVNESTHPVEILGYSGEPYAEVRPHGVYLNRNSPAAYLNQDEDSAQPVPEFASPAAAPQWLKASDQSRIRWHDHRAGWMSEAPPPAALSDPQSRHRVLEWTIPLRVGTEHHVIAGTVDWLPPPQTPVWIAGALMLAALITVVALATATARWIVPALATVAGLGALADAVGRSIVAADLDAAWWLVLLAGQAWPALAGIAAIAAAGYTVARKPGADLAWGLAGVAMALMAGVTRFGSFTSALTPTPWPGDLTRTMVLATLGIGVGLAVAALIITRRQPQPTAAS